MRFFAILLMLGLLRGQDKPTETEAPNGPTETAVIHVKTLDGDSFGRLVNLLGVFGAHIKGDDHLRTILVYGRPEVVTQVRHVVEELDRPGSEAALGRNIEITLTFLRCSTKAPATPEALPADIEPVAKQLRAVTQYKDIALWEVLPLRLQEGKQTSETLQLPSAAENTNIPGSSPPTASIRIEPDAVYRKDQVRYVRFRILNVNIKMPYYTGTSSAGQWNYSNVNLDTVADFAEGQRTIVGKLSGVDEGSAIFIVVALKILD